MSTSSLLHRLRRLEGAAGPAPVAFTEAAVTAACLRRGVDPADIAEGRITIIPGIAALVAGRPVVVIPANGREPIPQEE